MGIYNNWIKSRKVPVAFKDYPGYPIDRSLFDQSTYAKILSNGIDVSPLDIILAGSVHYNGRFGDGKKFFKFLNAFIEILMSVAPPDKSGHLFFTDYENSEFQGRSSEVIAVALSVIVTGQLFNVNRNEVGIIEGSGKRCDFYFIKDNLEYFVESKGRKRSVSSALNDIFSKKSHAPHSSPKYGIITKIPRGCYPTTIEIVDPEFTPMKVSKDDLISRKLSHYSKLMHLIGFSDFSKYLNHNSKLIATVGYKNITHNKVQEYNIEYDFSDDNSFKSRDGKYKFYYFKSIFEKKISTVHDYVVFAIESKLIEILSKNDFESLCEYSFSMRSDGDEFAFSSDGSALILKETLFENKSQG